MITKFKDHKNVVVSIDPATIKNIEIVENKIIVEYNDGKQDIFVGIENHHKTFTQTQFQHVKQFFEDLKTVI